MKAIPSLLVAAVVAALSVAPANEESLSKEDLDLLRIAHEPMSIRNNAGIEQYRLIFSQPFSVPIIVRVTKTSDRIVVRSVLFTGAETGRVADVRTAILTPKEWQALNSLAAAAQFWTMSFEDRVNDGLDGTDWTIEAFQNNIYHVITRWSPSWHTKQRQLERFVAFGRYFGRLSPHKFPFN